MTGGEYHTDNFILHMHKCLSGLEVDKPQAKDVFDYDDMTHAKIVGKLTAPSGLGYLEAFRREKNLPGGVRKAAVVAPYEVAVAGRDQLDALTPQVPEITKIINRSYGPWPTKAARTSSWMPPFSGPKSTWLDDGSTSGRLDRAMLRRRKSHAIAAFLQRQSARAADFACAPLRALGGHSGAARRRRRHRVFEVKYFFQWIERDAFKRMPKSMQLAAGIVDEGSYWVESVNKIRERIADWARVVGEERLWVSPSCGFGRHPSRSIPVLRAKMENMVEAARTL